jgi:hypothetical protein
VRDPIQIENIGQMRRERGIDDAELREEVRRLKSGDLVRLTLLTGSAPFGGETVVVRITSRKGPLFRGKLVRKPAAAALGQLRAGSLLTFSASHIHSVPRGTASRDR